MKTAMLPAVAVAMLCAIALTACGSASDTSTTGLTGDSAAQIALQSAPSGTQPEELLEDPCLFLSPNDLEVATGMAFGSAESRMGTATCRWEASSHEVAIEIEVHREAATFHSRLAQTETLFSDAAVLEIPGADEAYSADGGAVLGLAIGSDFVEVRVESSDMTSVIDRARQIAGLALTKL